MQFLLSSSGGDSKKTKSLPGANKDESQAPPRDSTNDAYTVNRSTPNTEIVENKDTFTITRRPAKPRSQKKED